MKILVLVSILFSSVSLYSAEDSEEYKKTDYQINWKYKAGEYLIYDCERGYYACVDKDANESCLKDRNLALEKKEKNLKCAPLKKFQNKKSCVIEDYKVVDINAFRRFCYVK